jgi:hypothetical protein
MSHPWSNRAESLFDSKKAQDGILETQFHPVIDPSVAAIIEVVEAALMNYKS